MTTARRNLQPQISKITTPTGLIRYQVRVDLNPGGAERKQSMRRFKTLREATNFLNPILGDQRRGLHTAPNKLTIKDAVEKWLKSQRIRPTTLAAYTAALRPLVDEYGSRTVQSITKDDLEDLVTALQDGTTQRGVWANTSINPMLARTRSLFDDLQKQGLVARNVAALVKSVKRAPGTAPARGKTLTLNEIQTLIRYHKGKHDEPLILLALQGLRRGELAAVRWADIDLNHGTVHVWRNRTTDGEQVYEADTKTVASTRYVDIPPDTLKRLKALKAGNHPMSFIISQEKRPGQPYHPRTIDARWTAALKAAGVPHVRLHDARHTVATRMLAEGVPLADAAEKLGHANAEVTARVYSHATQEGRLKAKAALTWDA
ncbi:tyrosine-type recombinase/integrase [Mycobacteroides abscessus]|uniref:tyrosine-type recombinase/integrase n=1 Tax=Mycobacteroides abscessus TaxID=36809 RepID=UPI0009AB74B6|nr:site-specific integrase [Mycobacteroides abscessus]